MKLVMGVVVGLIITFGIGWFWGASGRRDADRTLQTSEVLNGLLEARGAVLDARLDIYSVNFGNASQHLETARNLVRRVIEQLKSADRQDQARLLDQAVSSIDEAQRMAGQLDQGANSRAAAAANAINEVLRTTRKR